MARGEGLLAGCGKCSGFLLAVRRGRGNGGTTARSKAWLVFVLSSKFRCHDRIRVSEWSGIFYALCSSLSTERNQVHPITKFAFFFFSFFVKACTIYWLSMLENINIGAHNVYIIFLVDVNHFISKCKRYVVFPNACLFKLKTNKQTKKENIFLIRLSVVNIPKAHFFDSTLQILSHFLNGKSLLKRP